MVWILMLMFVLVGDGATAQVRRGPGRNTDPRRPTGPPIQLQGLRPGDVLTRGNPVARDAKSGKRICDTSLNVVTPLMTGGSYEVSFDTSDECVVSIGKVIDQRQVTALAAGPKRVTAYVWTYGSGGPADMLTELRAIMDWSWTGAYAAMTGVFAYCDTSPQFRNWWMSGCWNIFNQYNGSFVEQVTEGNYFWAPGGWNGQLYYIHKLINDRYGDRFGNGQCKMGFAGAAYSPPTLQCYVAESTCFGSLCFSPPPHNYGF